MPAYNLIVYEPPFDKIEKEQDLVLLLRDIGVSLKEIGALSDVEEDVRLKNIAEIARNGGFYFNLSLCSKLNLKSKFDLSPAKKLLRDYGEKSREGCRSCRLLGKGYESNETGLYCKLEETEKDIDFANSGRSKRVMKNYDSGCERGKPIFRPIEVVLEETGE
ncbi:hypothetical protein K9L16_00855 [Candidatus Pacearchaeota archaeon]|nr:hypothetical protein [Candidatus Pacearchaeota archaeon]